VHDGLVKALAFSPDGQTLAVGAAILESGQRGQVRLWRLPAAEPMGGPLFHPLPVWALAFAPDGRLLLTGCEDGRARFFEPLSGRLIGRPLIHEGNVTSVAFSPDGSTAATSSAGGDHSGASARLWDVPSQPAVVRALPIGRDASYVAELTPEPLLLLAANASPNEIERFDVHTAQRRDPPLRHGAIVRAVTIVPGSREVLTFGDDRTAKAWDLETGALRRTRTIDAVVGRAVVAPDGRSLLTASRDGSVCLRDLSTLEPRVGPLARPMGIGGIAFAADSTPLWIEAGDTDSACWRLTPEGRAERIAQWDDGVRSCGFGPGAALVVTRGRANRPVVRSPFADAPQGPVAARHADQILDFAVSHDGSFFVTGSFDGTARLWDVATGKPLGPPLLHPRRVTRVMLSADDRLLATQSDAAYLWPIPPPVDVPAAEVRRRIERLTGQELDAQGVVRDRLAPPLDPMRQSSRHAPRDEPGHVTRSLTATFQPRDSLATVEEAADQARSPATRRC
jgi:hypothetical protein